MGHWQQIRRDNAEERERRAALPRWRRMLVRYGLIAGLAIAWMVAIIVLLRVFGAI